MRGGGLNLKRGRVIDSKVELRRIVSLFTVKVIKNTSLIIIGRSPEPLYVLHVLSWLLLVLLSCR